MAARVAFTESYVAYLDILGFSEIVRQVAEMPESDHLLRLFRCHQRGAGIISSKPEYGLVQFSDSIVISRQYSSEKFAEFVDVVASYQRMLLGEGFLCRGGISRGSHYSNGTFMMSLGLVKAYDVEVSQARFPRIAVSVELLKLIGETAVASSRILQEDDGVFFVDYLDGLGVREARRLKSQIELCIEECQKHMSASVREKAFWLGAYSNKKISAGIRRRQFRVPDLAGLTGIGR